MMQNSMQLEVTAAINLIAASLYNKLPRRRVDAFAEEVEKGIVAKFEGHWYPDNPSKGAAYRCINVSGEKIDPLFIYAAVNSGLEIEEVSNYLPKDLIIWIDPGEVSFSIGDKSQVRILYSERRPQTAAIGNSSSDNGCKAPNASISPPIQFSSCTTAVTSDSSAISSPLSSPDELASSLSSSLGNLSLSSGASGTNAARTSWGTTPSPLPWATTSNHNPWSPVPVPVAVPVPVQKPAPFSMWNSGVESNSNANFHAIINPQPQSAFQVGGPTTVAPASAAAAVPRPCNNNNKTMTAAMFAQTKFGSTKLKNHTKRSSRLSPTEGFSRSLQGLNSYPGGSLPARQGPTMSSALLDRMQVHMSLNNQMDFPIDHFKMNGNSMRSGPSDRFNVAANINNGSLSPNGMMGRYPASAMNSSLSVMFASDQDWIDLSDMAVPSGNGGGNQLLAA